MTAIGTSNETLDNDSITVVLRRVIAENGREHLGAYAFAIACLLTVAMTTAFTAWIMNR